MSHYRPGCPHFIGEKIEGTEESGPLTPFSVHLIDLDLCSGDGLAVWGPVLSGPGPDHGTGTAALTPAWLGRTTVKESHLDSTPRLQSLVFSPPERGTGMHVDSSMCTVLSLLPVNTDSDTERDTRGSQTATLLWELFAKRARGKALLEP